MYFEEAQYWDGLLEHGLGHYAPTFRLSPVSGCSAGDIPVQRTIPMA